MNEVNWGIIGVGDVTETKSGPAFNKVAHSRLVMVMRRDLAKARDYAARHGVPGCTDNAADILNHPDIHAVYIATPPAFHSKYAILSAAHKKHVYVEKPMAITPASCGEMIDACRDNGVKLFVAYYRRELDYFKKIKQLVADGTIGDVKCVNIRLLLPPRQEDFDRDNLPWRVRPEIAGAGYFYDLASHQLDFLDFLLGPIQSACGCSANQGNLYDAEDIVTASLLFKDNILGSGTWCFTMADGGRVDQTELIGSRGRIIFSFFEPAPIRVTAQGKTESIVMDYPLHVQQPLIDTVVRDILGTAACVSTGESAARTNRVMAQILGQD